MIEKWRRRKEARAQKKANRRRRRDDRTEIAEEGFWAGAELSEPWWSRMSGSLGKFFDDLI